MQVQQQPENAIYKLKLSVDIREAKNFKIASSVFVKFAVQLAGGQHHQFKSEIATTVPQGTVETRLSGSFASYEFFANRAELGQMMGQNSLDVTLVNHDGHREVGSVQVPLRMLQEGEQKRTMTSMFIVSDKYLEVQQGGQIQGLLRVVLYLEDMGVASEEEVRAGQQQKDVQRPTMSGSAGGQSQSGKNPVEEQIVWQLEMWKRAEMAKFLAHLKQKEIEKIEEVTRDWKMKEAEREKSFNETVQRVTSLESKVRQKATDLQRREERIIQLEEELKSKIMEVSRQLTSKEEEIMNIKKKFKEERVQSETEKKKLTKELVDQRAKVTEATDRYYHLKREIEDSPLSVLRQELGTKQLEIVELESHVKSAREQRDDYATKYNQIKKDMISLKRQIDLEKEKQLEKQAQELEQLKTMMKTKAAQDDERRDFDMLRTQLNSLTNRLGEQASQEADEEAKAAKKPWASKRPTGGMQPSQRNVYFDDYARKQSSPTRSGVGPIQHTQTANSFTRPPPNSGGNGACEWDRLMREREELLGTGTYTADDPLILEIDRQIQASHIRANV